MKKFSYILAIIAIIFTLNGTACKNAPIFAAIEQEVKLKQSSVQGTVRGITRINTALYVSNGNLYTKSLGSTGAWKKIVSGNCESIATDGTNLYAVFFDKGVFKLEKNGKVQNKISGADNLGFITGDSTVFATDNKTVYTISGTAATKQSGIEGALKGAAGDYCLTTKGLYDKNGGKIPDSPENGSAICKGNGGVFVISGDTLYAFNGSKWTKKKHGVASAHNIAYLPTKKLILISGAKGYGEMLVDTTNPMNLTKAKTISAGSPDSSVPANCYQQYKNSVGQWLLHSIAAYEITNGYILYGGVVAGSKIKYTGLWGFYNPEQLQWNRE